MEDFEETAVCFAALVLGVSCVAVTNWVFETEALLAVAGKPAEPKTAPIHHAALHDVRNSSWRVVLRAPQECREAALRSMTRFDSGSFALLLREFSAAFFLRCGGGRPLRRVLYPEDMLGLALTALASGDRGYELSFFFALPPSTRSRYLGMSLLLLREALNRIPEAQIIWPDECRQKELGRLVASRVPALGCAFGALDGSIFDIQHQRGRKGRAYYNGHKCRNATKCIFVFGSDGTILYVAANLPGSWHDSHAAEMCNLYHLVDDTVRGGRCILADTAFRRGPRITCTCDQKALNHLSELDANIARVASKIVSNVRILVEMSIGGLKDTFKILRHSLPKSTKAKESANLRELVFDLCFRLWNYRVRRMHISEVATLFGVN